MLKGNKEDMDYICGVLHNTMYNIIMQYQNDGKRLNMADACLAITCFVCETFKHNNVSIELVQKIWDGVYQDANEDEDEDKPATTN